MMVSLKRLSIIVSIATHLGLQIAAVNLSPLIYGSDEILGPAIEVRQVLTGHNKRQSDTVGSWSLRALTCPEDTQDCGDSSITACCTKNTICVESVYMIACCPSETDCHRSAETLPSCADPSWSLWKNEDRDGYFCCLPGQRGYRTSSKLGACSDERIVLQPSQTLSSITPYKVNGDVVPSDPTRTANGGSGSGAGPADPTGDSESETRPTDSTGANTEQSKSGNGLSTGAIAGIVVGGILLLGAFAFGIWWAGKEGARKGAAAAAAALYTQQQGKPQFHVEDPSFNGANSTYQPPSAPQPMSQSQFGAVTGQPEIGGIHNTHPQTHPTQWAYEVDGHNLGTEPKNCSEMGSR